MIPKEIQEAHPSLIAIRRDLHAHPELMYEETRTSTLVAELLRSWGIEVHYGLAETGVVGTLRKGSSSRAIGIRADMDALPIQEENNFAHRSIHPKKMHACGHDGHTTLLLGAAQYLAKNGTFEGTVHFIFQPAEEGGAGAKRMIDEGLFDQFQCECIFGLHNVPGAEEGKLYFRRGPAAASGSRFDIAIKGRGAHAAQPHKSVDPLIIATHLVQALQTIVSRSVDPMETAVISVTQISCGDTYNAISDDAVIRGTVRAFSEDVLDLIERKMLDMTRLISDAFGGDGTLNFVRGYPAVVNTEAETEFASAVAEEVFGKDMVVRSGPAVMASEDFAYYLQKIPGSFLNLGLGNGDYRLAAHGEGPCTLHNASYDFNDNVIPQGATYWARLVEAYLKKV